MVTKVLPNQKTALIKNWEGPAILALWDIDNNTQFGDEIVINDFAETGDGVMAISPDGSKVAIVHRIY